MPGPEKDAVILGDGRRIAIEVEGNAAGGAPVLLVPPLGGAMALWGELREILASRARVIAFDRSGTGGSSDASIFAGTRRMALEPVAVLDHLGVAKAHVLGLSLGGMVATWLAIDAPGRVDRLCLASAPAAGLDLSRSAVGRVLSLAACLARGDKGVEPCLARRILSRAFREKEPARAAEIEASVMGQPARRLQVVKHATLALLHDARSELRRIRAPVLVLAGERDELIGIEPQRELAHGIAGARFETIAGAGHAMTLEKPKAVAERVARFFFEE
jgi:pimeloyl-ACP methyl ester carboxylesterase